MKFETKIIIGEMARAMRVSRMFIMSIAIIVNIKTKISQSKSVISQEITLLSLFISLERRAIKCPTA